jgi:plastocyanin
VVVASTVGASGTTFSPSTMTITHGQAVVFNTTLSGHTVNIDTFSGPSGTCAPTPTDFTTWTSPVTYTFSTPGTFFFHCDIHSGCGASTCGSSCGGMTGSVTVN